MKSLASQKGFLTMVTIILIVIIGFLGLAVTYMVFGAALSTSGHFQSDSAFYLGEAGLEHATHKMLEPNISERLGCNDINTTPIANTLGSGGYSVTSSGTAFYSGTTVPATTLSSALTTTATTIPVVSTTGYPEAGRIMIDSEFINYEGVAATSFNNATRGVDGSVAAAHASEASIGQYQCTVISTGAVPSIASPLGKRVVQQGVALQEAWIVGNNSGTDTEIIRWNNPTEVVWNTASFTTTSAALNGVFANSYSDVWAVGAVVAGTPDIQHWNGSTWTKFSPTVAVNADLNSVSCNASNNCWAVGAAQANTPLIEFWNGTSWARVLPTANANAALNSVFCNSSTDCEAVGAVVAGDPLIEHWNGTNWTKVEPTVAANAALDGVSCTSSSNCWAVGATVGGNPLIELWDGTNWTRVLPAVTVNGSLHSVFCNTASDCWAVGNVLAGNLLFLEHWNGTNWSATSPTVAGTSSLRSISCYNTNDCWATGTASAILHWDGTAWANVAAPSGFPSIQLNSITTIGPSTSPFSAWQENFD